MKIEAVNNYRTDENTYIVFKNNEAVVIDPGIGAADILKRADDLGVKIKYILLTHCHYDHICGLEDLRRESGAKVISGDKASKNIGDAKINLSAFSMPAPINAKASDVVFSDGETADLCGMKVKCIYTPGHTECGVCYMIDDALFSGDTLFQRNVGRSDLPTGNVRELEKSIREKIYTLPDSTAIYPGHGAPTSVGYEKQFNFFVSV